MANNYSFKDASTATQTAKSTETAGVHTPHVNVDSVPLPTGAATAANQETGNTSLASLETTLGEVQASPTSNTVLDRLKQLLTGIVLAAGTNLIGRTSASPETSTVYSGTTALTPKFAKIAASSSGNNTIVAAVTGKKIRVLAYNFMANGAVNAKFQDGAGGTDLTGLKYCAANGGICAPFNPAGWFETSSDTLLNLNLSGAVAVGGELTYVEV